MEKNPTNQARKLEIEKAAMSATGIIERRKEWRNNNESRTKTYY